MRSETEQGTTEELALSSLPPPVAAGLLAAAVWSAR